MAVGGVEPLDGAYWEVSLKHGWTLEGAVGGQALFSLLLPGGQLPLSNTPARICCAGPKALEVNCTRAETLETVNQNQAFYFIS